MNSTIIVTRGGTADDIRSELGSRCHMRKLRPGEAIGNYGDFVSNVRDADAVLMKMKHPKVVRII